ncbi:MAG: hypothetical protein ACI8R9_001709 [Paraglaciecola sp.]
MPELAKQVEATLCYSVLTQDEWLVLWKLDKKPNKPKVVTVKAPPSLQWAYLTIAKLGGFADTKRTGIAGGQRYGKDGIVYKLQWLGI